MSKTVASLHRTFASYNWTFEDTRLTLKTGNKFYAAASLCRHSVRVFFNKDYFSNNR